MNDKHDNNTSEASQVKPESALQMETQEAEDVRQSEARVPVEEPMDEKTEINRLLDEGYSVKQIIGLGFKRRTAYHYAKLRMQPENDPTGGSQSEGTSGAQPGKAKQELTKLGSKDVIPPEAVLEVLHLPRNGDAVEVWRRGVLDSVGMLLLGARYSQLTAAGQAEVVKNQLDIMREAKESSKDIAQEAAQQAAMQAASFIEQKMPRVEGSGEPNIAERMLGPMADMAGKQMSNMFARMFGMPAQGQPGGQPVVPSGWEYETEGGDE